VDTLVALRRTYEHAETVVAGSPPELRHHPTPCSLWDVQTLLNHIVAVLRGFPVVLSGQKADWTAGVLGEDPLTAFRDAADDNLRAWRAEGALEAPSPKLPGMRLVEVNLLDTLTHTWDLATATGQANPLSSDVVEHAYRVWRDAPLDVSRAAGAFAPRISVPADAPTMDRLVALLGRQP
jgi:uncharacterized protein (TIGR03086 family)